MIYRKVFLFAFLAILSFSWALKSPRNLDNYSFEDYMKEFKKSYRSHEISHRRSIFENKLAAIREHNAANASWFLGVNKFTDMTEEEHSGLHGYKLSFEKMKGRSDDIILDESNFLNGIQLPKSVDWREKGVVTPVKDQGSCGSCWAFSVAQSVESHLAISTGTLIDLSEEELVSCTPDSFGCDGGTLDSGFNYVKTHGLTNEDTFPYTSISGREEDCPYNSSWKKFAQIDGYHDVLPNRYLPLMEAVATKGPIGIGVDASKWSSYEGGIFDGCDNSYIKVNHAVQLIGYGEEDGIPYWLIRNSWGTDWGEDGYIRIKRYTSESPCSRNKFTKICGNCGILFSPSFPTGVH